MTAKPKPPRTDLSGLCTVCGTRIDPVAGTVHPLCEPGVMADFLRADIREANRRKGNAGKAKALKSDPEARAWALNQIRALTYRQQFVSADDVRDEFDAYGVPMKMRGGLWATAKARGWVSEVDQVASAGESAHGKPIARYLSRNYKPADGVA